MNRRALKFNDQSRSDRPAALAGGVDLSSAPPTSNTVGHSVLEAASYFDVDQSTIRRDIQRGCPVLRRGSRGPGRGARLELHAVAQWRGRARGQAGLTPEEALQRIAFVLWASLSQEHVDVRAGIQPDDAAAVLFVVWEQCCQSFASPACVLRLRAAPPAPIRALVARIVDSVQ